VKAVFFLKSVQVGCDYRSVYCSHKTNVGTVEALGHNIQFPHMFAAKETIVEVDTSFQF